MNCENFEFHADENPEANYCKNHVELEILCNTILSSPKDLTRYCVTNSNVVV